MPGKTSSDHRSWHLVRLVLAIVLATATILYSAIWMYYIRMGPRASLGLDYIPNLSQRCLLITHVQPGGPADRIGLRAGDHIVSIYSRPIRTTEPIYTAIVGGRAGDQVPLGILQAGTGPTVDRSIVLQEASPSPSQRTLVQRLAGSLLNSFPVLFVVVGLSVLFLRIDDRNAWLLAICFAAVIASAPMLQMAGIITPRLRPFTLAYAILFFPLLPATFYYLFTTFPVRSPIDQVAPWLKNILVAAAAIFSVPMAAVVFAKGSVAPLWPFLDRIPESWGSFIVQAYYFGGCGLALLSLAWNNLGTSDRQARRRIRVMVWGTVLGLVPWMILQGVAIYQDVDPYALPFWAWAPSVLAIFLLPLSFAYAVVKHRVLEIPVLLRRSARYLLVQRGFLILMLFLGVSATLALAQSFSRKYPASSGAAIPVGAVFGIVLVGGGTWIQQRVSEHVDKAFFRKAYDSKQILENLVERTRDVRTREQLSELLEINLQDALQPVFLLIYFAEQGEFVLWGRERAEAPEIFPRSHLVDAIFERGKLWESRPDPFDPGIDRLRAECLVPISGREHQRWGLLVLGPRKSEEPYSREDKRLLATIASQAGSMLENIHLGEEIAERVETERRVAHEIELARQVQRKLFPQNPPQIATLDYAGECVQARVVGGDYYDFLELSPGLIGFALADISGKGFPAALLMANLQANLRGQYALAADDMPGLLQCVNRLFCDNTEPNHYATMFFGCYDAKLRRLRYVNCGHNPPVLLRADNSVERLAATATVMGLFPEWDCSVAEEQLHPGDLFVIYTDGVTEAADPTGDEFGEERLIETLRGNRNRSAASLLRSVIQAVQQFSPGEQGDDITVVVAMVV